jgi:hypothetical protein
MARPDKRGRRPRRVKLLGDLEATLTAEVDVDQYHVRPQVITTAQCVRAARGCADDRDALGRQQTTSSVDEIRTVVDD